MWIFQNRLSMDWECNLKSIELVLPGDGQIGFCNHYCTDVIGTEIAPAYIMLHTDSAENEVILVAYHYLGKWRSPEVISKIHTNKQLKKDICDAAQQLYDRIVDGLIENPGVIDLRMNNVEIV